MKFCEPHRGKEPSDIMQFSKQIARQLERDNASPQEFFDSTVLVNQTISDTVKIRDTILEEMERSKKNVHS